MTTTRMFDLTQITTPLLLHMLGKELRFPRLFLLMRKLTLILARPPPVPLQPLPSASHS